MTIFLFLISTMMPTSSTEQNCGVKERQLYWQFSLLSLIVFIILNISSILNFFIYYRGDNDVFERIALTIKKEFLTEATLTYYIPPVSKKTQGPVENLLVPKENLWMSGKTPVIYTKKKKIKDRMRAHRVLRQFIVVKQRDWNAQDEELVALLCEGEAKGLELQRLTWL